MFLAYEEGGGGGIGMAQGGQRHQVLSNPSKKTFDVRILWLVHAV